MELSVEPIFGALRARGITLTSAGKYRIPLWAACSATINVVEIILLPSAYRTKKSFQINGVGLTLRAGSP